MKTRNFIARAAALTALAAASAALAADIQYAGVNLSGAEFGMTVLPGSVPNNYSYPTTADITYYKSKGMNFIRLPFRWERLQHTNSGPLDPTELGRIQNFVGPATAQGLTVLLDPHNFQRYYPNPRTDYQTATDGLVGSSVPDSDFTNFWSLVASVYRTNPLVIFGLNNEPNGMPTEQLVTSENAAIAAIRDTGASNIIFVPGNAYTGAWTWTQNWYGTANSSAMLNVVDRSNNIVFEAHQYLDSDGSGTTTNINNNDNTTGSQRLSSFTQWLRSHHRRGFLGEFAVANNTITTGTLGGLTLTNMLGYIQTNADVWLGWAWWGGGPNWGNYMFTIEPKNIGKANQADQPVMGVVKHFFPLPVPALQLAAGPKIQFMAPQGFVYQVQSTANLNGAWTNFGAAFSGTGAMTNVAIPTASHPLGFYRVSVIHAP